MRETRVDGGRQEVANISASEGTEEDEVWEWHSCGGVSELLSSVQ